MKIPIEILSLLSPAGFEKRFHKNCQIINNYRMAYEMTEKTYQENFGKRRYASYDSFRVTKNKKIRNNTTL